MPSPKSTDLATSAGAASDAAKPSGKKPPTKGEKEARGQLAEVANKLASSGKRFKNMREHAADAGLELVRTLETGGTAFVMGLAEGYSPEYMKIGGKVRWRGLVGLGLKGWGVAAKLKGKSGDHQGAFGDGFIAAEATSIGIDAGQTLRAKKDGNLVPKAAPTTTPTPPAADTAPPAKVEGIDGPLREIADDGLDMSGDDFGRERQRKGDRLERRGRLLEVSVLN